MDASSIRDSKVPGSNPGADTLTFEFLLAVTEQEILNVYEKY